VVYTESNVGLIHQFTQLDDGTALYMRLTYPNCEFETPVGELVRFDPTTQHAETLAEGLASRADAARRFLEGQRFIVSPDQKVVLWLEQGENGVENWLFGISLETGVVFPVLADGEQLMNLTHMLWVSPDA
jgi:hypothetical protein